MALWTFLNPANNDNIANLDVSIELLQEDQITHVSVLSPQDLDPSKPTVTLSQVAGSLMTAEDASSIPLAAPQHAAAAHDKLKLSQDKGNSSSSKTPIEQNVINNNKSSISEANQQGNESDAQPPVIMPPRPTLPPPSIPDASLNIPGVSSPPPRKSKGFFAKYFAWCTIM
jgi:hypothetical protein